MKATKEKAYGTLSRRNQGRCWISAMSINIIGYYDQSLSVINWEDIGFQHPIQDLLVFTVARVIFQLAEEIPCISAVVVALLADPKPRIYYTLKAVGGSLTAIPRLSDMIDDTVDTIVKDMLQWPHRIVVPIGGIPVYTSDLELKPQGKVIVTVAKATNLKNKEMIGKSDPYERVYIRPVFKYKTKTVDNNLNPVWDGTLPKTKKLNLSL